MDCQKIESIINELKVDSLGRIRNKSKVIDKIYIQHISKIDKELMDIRIFVAQISTGHTTHDALKFIDEFIYKKQIK